ncbi:MAG TPA: dynamin family protein [Chloroflexota bacterium]|nr:dynamin family protein [Chloroflexota bacterium]
MSEAGYEAARRKADGLAAILREVALLLGKPASEAAMLVSGRQVMPGLGMEAESRLLEARVADLEHRLFTLIVLGEFKNGKSTLINAMLGSKLLPAKAAPATAIITMLTYGESDVVQIWESGGAEPRRLPVEDFVREFQLTPKDQETIQEHGAVDRFSQVEYAVVETSAPLCAQGVTLVDSPGLGEHLSRTRVATEFLRRSQAAIVVLNATRILSRDERVFIDTVLGRGRLPHVFFVVNRIDQVDAGTLEEIKNWLPEELAAHFAQSNGSFDENLYRRRVFFTDARTALNSRMPGLGDEEALKGSGVPALEAELERFLTGEERISASIQSAIAAVDPLIDQGYRRMEQTEAALDEPLGELETRGRNAEEALRALDRRREESARTIHEYGDVIKQKVFADLRGYVEEMRASWEEDSRRLMDIGSSLSLRNVITAHAQEETRREIAAAITAEVQKYVQVKFEAWSERVPERIGPDIDLLVSQVETQLGDLQDELQQIAATFSGSAHGERTPEGQGAGLFRLALSSSEIATLTDAALGIGDMGGFIGHVVQSSVVAYVLRSVIGETLLSAAVMLEAVQAGVHESGAKRRLRQALGERLIDALRDRLEERREFIYAAVGRRFDDFAMATSNAITTQIAEVREDQARILRQKADQSFSIEREKERLAAIREELSSVRDRLHAMGK